MRERESRQAVRILTLLGFFGCFALGIWAWRTGILTSQEAMAELVRSGGFWAPLLFVLLQIVQVVVPILPGGISCLIGVLLFGPYLGFCFNYAGICLGSMLAFEIARSCGRPVLTRLFPTGLIEKYDKWTGPDRHFNRWFALAILLPVAPDDFLCYLAGTTKLSRRKFSAIIWICKPFSIAIYSLLLSLGWNQILHWFA